MKYFDKPHLREIYKEAMEKRALQLPSNNVIVSVLNDLLASEMTAVSQYMVQSEMCANWGYDVLAKMLKKDAIDEMKHAEKHIERIIFLVGIPDLRLKEIKLGASIPEMLQNNLASEREAIDSYNQAIATCFKVGDTGTRKMLEPILVDEEAHHDRSEALLGQLKQMGIQVFLSEQTGD